MKFKFQATIYTASLCVVTGTTFGNATAIGGHFTASGADDNYSLFTELGAIQFGDLSGIGTRMVVADASGLLSTQSIPSGGGADNLGNHTATQNIDLSDFSLENVNNYFNKFIK